MSDRRKNNAAVSYDLYRVEDSNEYIIYLKENDKIIYIVSFRQIGDGIKHIHIENIDSIEDIEIIERAYDLLLVTLRNDILDSIEEGLYELY